MDVQIVWDSANGRGDWAIANGGLAIDIGGLTSAVLVSLFTDGRAPDDLQLPSGTTDRRGWWADTYETSNIGSLLWTLARAKKAGNNSGSLLRRAEGICQDALQWLVTDGIAASIAVTAIWITPTAMGITIVISEPSGGTSTFRYSWAWNGIG